jgi:hypothetical protein
MFAPPHLNIKTIIAALAYTTIASVSISAWAQQPPTPPMFTGDTKLACEAIMCLTATRRPHECEPSIRRYINIVATRPWKTIELRTNFLKMCPSTDPKMIGTIVASAGNCDAQGLNATLRQSGFQEDAQPTISNSMPQVCQDFMRLQGLSDSDKPKYVGTPENGGYWVEAAAYDQALKQYQAKLAEQAAVRAAQQEADARGNGGN